MNDLDGASTILHDAVDRRRVLHVVEFSGHGGHMQIATRIHNVEDKKREERNRREMILAPLADPSTTHQFHASVASFGLHRDLLGSYSVQIAARLDRNRHADREGCSRDTEVPEAHRQTQLNM